MIYDKIIHNIHSNTDGGHTSLVYILHTTKTENWQKLLSLAYAVTSVQPLSGRIGSGVKSWQTTFKLVHWAIIYNV